MKPTITMIFMWVTITACSHNLSIETIENLKPYAEKDEHLGTLATGSIQLGTSHVLVNQDFSMGTAMSLGLMGPAIAAGQRSGANKKTISYFSKNFTVDFRRAFKICGSNCEMYSNRPFSTYAILYGKQQATLVTVIDFLDKIGPNRFISISRQLPLKGETSWSEHNGSQVFENYVDSIRKIGSLEPTFKNNGNDITCHLTPSTRLRGNVILKKSNNTIIQLPSQKGELVILLCPNDYLKSPPPNT
ncbi:MAG: hypothetical protein HRU19_30395 [Pseudobacteriovorax sp.]|nr:hypothetical protein [Pseudobacteriovorax sp.]